MKHILVVDDDIHIGNMVEEVLIREGYRVSRAYSGTEALLFLSTESPDLVLLDLMLPGCSGEKVLAKITQVPVIVVSAKVDVGNKVELLLGGAADYITKPFEVEELLARITVQLRKFDAGRAQPFLTVGELQLDTAAHTVFVKDIITRLTRTEYAILKLLMQHPRQVLTKSVILDRICEDTPDCTESSLKQHISNLRKKLRDVGGREYIEAVWGIGFKLVE